MNNTTKNLQSYLKKNRKEIYKVNANARKIFEIIYMPKNIRFFETWAYKRHNLVFILGKENNFKRCNITYKT